MTILQNERRADMPDSKPWYLSKTIISSGAAFGVALATGVGLIDTETGMKVETLMIPMILTFLRLGNKELI